MFLQELKDGSVADKFHYRNEMVLAENALECTTAVVSVDKSLLEKYKKKFDSTSRGSASSGSNGMGKREETLRSTPPTGSIASLITLQECNGLSDLVHTDIDSRADWQPLKAKVAVSSMTIRELIKELKNRLASIEVRKKSKSSSADKPSSGPTVRDG